MNRKKIEDKFLTFFLFIIIFIIGYYAYDDYGIGIDEDNSRVNGFVSLKYIYEIFNINFLNEINNIKLENISNYGEQGNGVVFDLPLAFLEIFFNISDFRDQFLIRHFASFIIFYISLIYFYKIILDRNSSRFLALLGVLFLFFSPRIFAQSFFNPKDIGFMSLCIIDLYYGIKFLEKKNLKSSLVFSLISGLTIGFRIVGLIIPLIIILFAWIDQLRNKELYIKKYLPLIILILSLPFFITIFWPYLWSDPFNNFINAFKILSNHYRPVNNFFMGEYISALYVPWYYVLVWVSVTTPLLYLFFFVTGFYFIGTRLLKRLIKINENNSYNDLWSGHNEKKDLIFLLTIVLPIFITIIFHSSLYTGWRHFYFIYPPLILISIQGVHLINLLFFKNIKIFLILICFSITPIIFWSVKNHPYQYVYFNALAGKEFNKYFEMDYWGVGNYNALNYLVNTNNANLKIGIIGNADIRQSRMFLDEAKRKKIEITDNFSNVDFLIDNYVRWNGIKNVKKNFIIKKNFETYHDIKVDNISIIKIYKKKL